MKIVVECSQRPSIYFFAGAVEFLVYSTSNAVRGIDFNSNSALVPVVDQLSVKGVEFYAGDCNSRL